MVKQAVDEILERCAGLPLFLAVAGKGVKMLSLRPGHKGCIAYRSYAKTLKTNIHEMMKTRVGSYEGLSKGLKISIQLVEERKKRFDFDSSVSMAEMHRRLSVTKKQMQVPMNMLKHLWELEHECDALRIAKEFEQVGLANIEFQDKEGFELVEELRLHDSVYEFTMYETKIRKEDRLGHKTVLKGYAKALQRSDARLEWWSEKLENDKYIHRNLCRHLAGAGFKEELFSLLLSPKWLERQVDLNGVSFSEQDFCLGVNATQRRNEKRGDGEGDDIEEALQMIGGAITLSSSYILRNRGELWFQVHGRLKKPRNQGTKKNKLVREYETKIEIEAPKPGLFCMNTLLAGAGGANLRILPIGNEVCCMALMNDRKRVALGCGNGDILIVNICRSEIELPWRAHDLAVTAIDVSNDGTRIVSGYQDGTAKVWSSQSGQCAATIDPHDGTVNCVSIAEDGKRVVFGTDQDTIQVWDLEIDNQVRPSITGDCMKCLTVFRDREHALIGRRNGELEIWHIPTSKKVGGSFRGHAYRVEFVAMTSDESRLATGWLDDTVSLWDLSTSQKIGHSSEGHSSPVSCVAITDDGRRVASGSADNMIRIWDTESWEEVCDPLTGHTGEITGVSVLGESDTIVLCSLDGTVRLWDLRRKRNKAKDLDKQQSYISSVSFSPNGRFVVSRAADGALQMWDAIAGKAITEPLRDRDSYSVSDLAITPDGRFVFSVSHDDLGCAWDLQTQKKVRIFDGYISDILCVAVKPDSKHAETGSCGGVIQVWDLELMEGRYFILEGHRSDVNSFLVSDDGKRAISVDDPDSIWVCDIETKTDLKSTMEEGAQKTPRRQVLFLAGEAMVHDQSQLSIGPFGNEIVYKKGRKPRVLGTLESTIYDWNISPDKKTLCVGLENEEVGFLKLKL